MFNIEELTKMYYSIGEVAKIFDVNTSLIRFWEKEFPSVIKPKKNKRGNRLFTPDDILKFKKIYHLIKIEGRTLDGAKKILKLKYENENFTSEKEHTITQLHEIRKKLITLKKSLV